MKAKEIETLKEIQDVLTYLVAVMPTRPYGHLLCQKMEKIKKMIGEIEEEIK